jgi:hypothetical protein
MTHDREAGIAALRQAALTTSQRTSLIRRRPALKESLDGTRPSGAFANYIGEHRPEAAPR